MSSPLTSSAKRILAMLFPVWRSAFQQPVSDGHVRLRGLTWGEQQAARFGLVALAGLLVSLLMAERWRTGELLAVGDGPGLYFLPSGLMAVTLTSFLVAWALITWGALGATWWVRILVAVVFVLTNGSLSIPASLDIGDHWILEHNATLLDIGFYGVPAVLVLSIAVRWLPTRAAAYVTWVLRFAALGLLGAVFLTHLWTHAAYDSEGFTAIVQQQLAASVSEIDGLLLPLVYVAAVLVIDFSLNMSLGVAQTIRETPLDVARWLLVALLAVKLWFLLFDELGEWATLVTDRPATFVRTLLSVAALLLMVRLVSRIPVSDKIDEAKERMLYLTALGLAMPSIVALLVVGVGVVVIAQRETTTPWFVRDYPTQAVADYGLPALMVVAIVYGAWLLRRRRTPFDAELGSGLLCIGSWALASLLLNHANLDVGFTDKLVDLGATLFVIGVLAMLWRRLTSTQAVVLAAVTVFTWLAMTGGDWIALVGAWFALPATVVTVVGIVMSVSGDAGFTARGGRVLPQPSRVLIYVGYVLLSVTLFHWVTTTHSSSNSAYAAGGGFFFIGIPWAAWVVGRKLMHLDAYEAIEEAEDAAEEAAEEAEEAAEEAAERAEAAERP